MSNLKQTKIALKSWNLHHFGHIQSRIQELKTFLHSLPSLPQNDHVLEQERLALAELNEIWIRERLLWKAKARVNWLTEGDANTHFFHTSTITHHMYNHIHSILDDHEVRVFDPDLIGDVFVKFYTNLFSSAAYSFPLDFQGLIRPSITPARNAELIAPPSPDEVVRAVRSMNGFKSPGPDGMSPLFYKKNWGIIGVDVIHAVQDFFQGGTLTRAVNHTFLTLIPKRAAANKVEQFRPISLCNVFYKVITKILALRFKSVLNEIIHASQIAFIPTRSILDNVLMNHEVMMYLNSRKGKLGYMAVKVDMTKAYDMVEWNVLTSILSAHGFCDQLTDLVSRCISSIHFSVLVNGSPSGFFQGSRGLRQGDPISPALFTLLADLLSQILSRSENLGKLSGIKVSRTSPRVTHLMYADDLVIYCKANSSEALEVKSCLDTYCQWTDQRINWDKSDIHFGPNVSRHTRRAICELLNMRVCTHNSKYLGSPFCKFNSKSTAFNYLAERLAAKLASWKSKHLSFAGRTTLIKSVSMVIPSYVMQVFLLPVNLCDKLDRLNMRFLWGISDDRERFLSLRSWDRICVPKGAGGLGLRCMRDVNEAYITKLGWLICTELGKTWVKLIRSKYLRGRRTTDFHRTSPVSSWVWSGIYRCKEALDKGLCFKVGQHSQIRLLDEPWIPDAPCFRDLMHSDGSSWNAQLISAIFPSSLRNLILSTPIFAREQDCLVWVPTASGNFSVRSSYRTNHHSRFSVASRLDSKLWKLLWKSPLHERHKCMVWKMLNAVIPTKNCIRHFLNLTDLTCFLCKSGCESLNHLLFDCPVAKLCWLQSPWQIRIDHFAEAGYIKWFQLLLDDGDQLPMADSERNKLLHYAVLVFEQMWMTRNRIRLGGNLPDWHSFGASILKLSQSYWEAGLSRTVGRRRVVRVRWTPPPLGDLKLNFDVSLIDKSAISAIILRNHYGVLKGAWINHFFSSNSFCAEMEAAIQALSIAADLHLPNVWFEGDALQVILLLQGIEDFCDWRAHTNIVKGRLLLKQFPFWCFNHVNRSCNIFAHNLASWARVVNAKGKIDVTTIPLKSYVIGVGL